MSHVFLDTHDGRLALYLNGDLQFDRDDERLYHEPLGLIPVALAARRAEGRALRVLVLGGGDGLALREIFRFSIVSEAHVVDRYAAVLALARNGLAELNGRALFDPRARVHVADARDFLSGARDFDVVVCDLTYPRDLAGAAVFTIEFFERVRRALGPRGVVAVNAVSPELTPEAFGCVAATLGAAGLTSVPYAFELPSFLAEGYGRWGFLFASVEPITDDELREIRLPDGTWLTSASFFSGTELPDAVLSVCSGAEERHGCWRGAPSVGGLGAISGPHGVGEALRASAGHVGAPHPNVTDELLYYIANATRITRGRRRFGAIGSWKHSSAICSRV